MELKFITQSVCSGCSELDLYLRHNHPNADVEKINIDNDPSAIEMYDIMGTPTLILWNDDEIEEVERMVGYNSGSGGAEVDRMISKL